MPVILKAIHFQSLPTGLHAVIHYTSIAQRLRGFLCNPLKRSIGLNQWQDSDPIGFLFYSFTLIRRQANAATGVKQSDLK